MRAQQAWYFDGHSAARVPAEVALHGADLQFSVQGNAEPIVWTHGSFTVERFGFEVRFVRQPYTGESVLVVDEVFAELSKRNPGSGIGRSLVALAICAAVLVASVLFAAGPVTNFLARHFPDRADAALGSLAVKGMAPESARLADPEVTSAVEIIRQRLAVPGLEFRVVVAESPQINAFALPGGWIVLNCGLIRAMESGDQVAAVLAHEVTHIRERHSLRNLIRTVGARMALAMLIGGSDSTVDFAAMLGALRYMREDEAAADSGASQILRASGISPDALREAFRVLEKKAPTLPNGLEFLSSHPAIQERARAAAREAENGSAVAVSAVLSEGQWKSVIAACRCK